jgi:hypothetical protein
METVVKSTDHSRFRRIRDSKATQSGTELQPVLLEIMHALETDEVERLLVIL